MTSETALKATFSKKSEGKEETFAERYKRMSARVVTPEEILRIAREVAIADRDPKNWKVYTVEETGPHGSLGVSIPRVFDLEP